MQPCEPADLIELPPEPSMILEGLLFSLSNVYISKLRWVASAVKYAFSILLGVANKYK